MTENLSQCSGQTILTPQQLLDRGTSAKAPFTLQCVDHFSRIVQLQCSHCLSIKSHLRRWNLVVNWHGRQAVAKLFFGVSARYHAGKNLRGTALLETAGIPTPASRATISAKDLQIVIQDYIAHGRPLPEVLADDSEKNRRGLTRTLAEQIKRCFDAGLRQRDMGLNNFLVSDGKLMLIDTEGIRRNRCARKRRQDLGRLLLELPQQFIDEVRAVLVEYLPQDISPLLRQAVCRRRRDVIRRLSSQDWKKLEIRQQRHSYQAVLRSAISAELQKLLTALPRHCESGDNPDHPAVIHQGSFSLLYFKAEAGRYSHFYRDSAARHWWYNAFWLQRLMLAAYFPAPLGLVERRGDSWIILPRLQGIRLSEHRFEGEPMPFDNALLKLFKRLKFLMLSGAALKPQRIWTDASHCYLLDLHLLQGPKRAKRRVPTAPDTESFIGAWTTDHPGRRHCQKLLADLSIDTEQDQPTLY